MPLPIPNLDDRTFDQLVDEAKALIPKHFPAWSDHNFSDPGITFVELFAFLIESAIYQINRVPDRSLEHFGSLLGVARQPGEPIEMLFRRVREKLDARERAVTQDEIEQQILAQPAETWPKNQKIARAEVIVDLHAAPGVQQSELRLKVIIVPEPSRANDGSSLFSVDDFQDLSGFVAKLRTLQDPISAYLWNQFSASTQGVLTSATSSPEQQKLALVQALNNILKGVLIFETVRFAGVKLSTDTLELKLQYSQNPQGTDLIRLNRLLLEDAYTLEIAKSLNDLAPEPSRELRQRIFKFLNERVLIATRLHVLPPDYYSLFRITATVVRSAQSRLDRATIRQNVVKAVRDFLHPTRGGDDGRGWQLGRSIFRSELYGIIEGLPGVDHVRELRLLDAKKLRSDGESVPGQFDPETPPTATPLFSASQDQGGSSETVSELPLPGPTSLIKWSDETFAVTVVDE
jgi:hypothetical protein